MVEVVEVVGLDGCLTRLCYGKFTLVSMGGRVEGLACADPGARTPIGASGNFHPFFFIPWLTVHLKYICRTFCQMI